jgi:predicted nucleic acid-binding OB-fold protein
LLLQVLPEVAKETCFALHGGTAINLFIREMPRLSVDIDLTYIPIEDRSTSLKNIIEALSSIKTNIERVVPEVKITLKEEILKLQITTAKLCLLSSNRPLNEMLQPNLIDQQETMVNQFEGMSSETFTYKDFENSRVQLIEAIHQNLTDKDKEFLLSFNKATPDWSIYDFERFPAVQWKLQNLKMLKTKNLEKFNKFEASLEETLKG